MYRVISFTLRVHLVAIDNSTLNDTKPNGFLSLVLLSRGSFGQIFKGAFFGADAIRFGSFFGTFSFLWKLVNNGLKLYRGTDDRINGAIAGI